MPQSGRSKLTHAFGQCMISYHAAALLTGNDSRVLLRVLAVEHAVEERDRLLLGHLHRHAHLLHGFEVDVRAQHPLGDAGVVRRALDHAPAPELRQPPLRVDLLRIVAVPVREDHVDRILLDAAVAVVVLAHQPLEDDCRRAVDVGGPRDDLGELRPVLHLVEVDAGQVQRLEDRLHRLRILRGELLGERAHLLGMVLPHLLRRDRREADAVFDGAVVPRLADAEAVHLVDLHVGDHLRRRNRDEADVLVRVDAAGREPVAHPHRVRARRERHRERQRLAGGLGLVGQRLDVLRLADAGLSSACCSA